MGATVGPPGVMEGKDVKVGVATDPLGVALELGETVTLGVRVEFETTILTEKGSFAIVPIPKRAPLAFSNIQLDVYEPAVSGAIISTEIFTVTPGLTLTGKLAEETACICSP